MSRFDIDYREWGHYDIFYTEGFDPAAYLECEDEDDLYWQVLYDIAEAAREGGNAHLTCSDMNFRLPEKFVEEWKHLKALHDS